MDTKSIPKPKGTPVSPDPSSVITSKRKSILKSIFPTNVVANHEVDDDTLLDVHIGNPLRKITKLLEEIKKQKAFSFTLKGSLGIAGIAVVVTTFGIFGGTKAFCSKGVQSHVGTVRELQMTDTPDRSYIMERAMVVWDAITGNDFTRRQRQRIVLVKSDESLLTLKERVDGLLLTRFPGRVIVTGDFDSCSHTLTIKNVNGVESL
ncbi:MAG TPA: hypothetical protein PLD54_01445 [Candidatus Levybacteria bacterium]|nr:hypothetical protein [Candidatus Levybacteria bacterium]